MPPRAEARSNAPQIGRLAEALRRLREVNGWTLADVSARTGLSISSLSKVQNGQMSLTYDKLVSLSGGLGVDVTYFFDPDRGAATAEVEPRPSLVTARRSVNRAGDGAAIWTPMYDYLYPASDLSSKRLLPLFAELKAHSLEAFGPLMRHSGEEFTVVLEGRVEVHTEFYAPVVLEVGDSIYFDSTMGHAYLAADEGRCRVVSVCTSAESPLEATGGAHGEAPARGRPRLQVRRGRPDAE